MYRMFFSSINGCSVVTHFKSTTTQNNALKSHNLSLFCHITHSDIEFSVGFLFFDILEKCFFGKCPVLQCMILSCMSPGRGANNN